ncbi:MAG: V-type ATP synthase subunit A, partial [Methylococcales bacterium]|nr:V-type ATP synthase subunit A [Methylococcales bacterium]
MMKEKQTTAKIIAVQDDIVSIKTDAGASTPLTKNEVVYILPSRSSTPYTERLKAEVLRIKGDT